MMNVTIAALSIKQLLETSPMFVSSKNLQIRKSQFNKFTSTVFFQPKNLLLYRSVFSNSLSSVIKSESSLKNYTGKITQTISNITESNIVCDKCTFVNLSSATNGAAISIDTTNANCNLSVSNSVFQNCHSEGEEGGAIYSRGYSSLINRCCFVECSSETTGHSIFVSVPHSADNVVNVSTVLRCPNKIPENRYQMYNVPVSMVFGHVVVFALNVSQCHVKDTTSGLQIYTMNGSVVAQSQFESNYGGSVAVIRTPLNGPNAEVVLTNFVNNTAGIVPLFYGSGSALFLECAFMENNWTAFAKPETGGAFVFERCAFDVDSIPGEPNVYFANNTLSQKLLRENSLLDTEMCPAVPYKLDEGSKLAWWIILIIVIACVVVVGAIIGCIIKCLCCKKDSKSSSSENV